MTVTPVVHAADTPVDAAERTAGVVRTATVGAGIVADTATVVGFGVAEALTVGAGIVAATATTAGAGSVVMRSSRLKSSKSVEREVPAAPLSLPSSTRPVVQPPPSGSVSSICQVPGSPEPSSHHFTLCCVPTTRMRIRCVLVSFTPAEVTSIPVLIAPPESSE